ncbi:MAG: cytochrome C oxidase subunit IV family protein [Gemmataceae bacterium]|nr:cytochrome C oxidase subunit IV family protein [Gemmataceae bacterium]
MSEQHHDGGHDAAAVYKAYITIFVVLCVFTAVSFACNALVRAGVMLPMVSMAIITAVAVAKAGCVAFIFMHLKWDWGKVYCIMVPVLIMCVMMMIVLLPDGVLGWPKN